MHYCESTPALSATQSATDKDKSMIHVFYIQYSGISKGTCWAEVMSNAEKIKLVENSTKQIFSYQPIWVALKTLLGLVKPNQYCQSAIKVLWGWYSIWSIFL